MKLSKKQFCDAVETLQRMMEEEDRISDVLDVSPEWIPGTWVNEYFDLLTEVSELEEDPMYGTDLDWFVFDTAFGTRKDMVKVIDKNTERTWYIETPETLYDFITRDE